MPDWIVPTLPSSFTAIEGIYTTVSFGLLQIVRARWMRKRSAYIDRFGWSIITMDYILGFFVALGVAFGFYPGLNIIGPWFDHIGSHMVSICAIWQVWEIWKASDERVEAAVGGLTNGNHIPPDSPYDGPDRRVGDPDRRREGMIARGLI